jgi:hypothetical protein
MKRLAALLFVLLVGCVFSSCGPSRTTEGVPSPGYDYSKVVAGIVKLHNDADDKWFKGRMWIAHWGVDAPARLPEEFDPNAYFSVLKHLSMADECLLDFAYFDDRGDGGPLLYVRRMTTPPFKTYKDYQEAVGGELPRSGVLPDVARAFLDQVRTDGSPESFFELVVLYELAGQFYLQWHFCYNHTRIVASPDQIDDVISDHAEFNMLDPLQPFTQSQRREANRMDVRPRVRFLSEDTAEVSLVTFSDWGGFTRKTYRIRRDFPHKIVEMPSKTLVEYDCGAVI